MGKYACEQILPPYSHAVHIHSVLQLFGTYPAGRRGAGISGSDKQYQFPCRYGNNRVLCSPDYRACRAQRHQVLQTSFQAGGLYISVMVIEEFVRPISLTFRLYGNIYGEEAVINSFFDILPLGLPIIMQALSVLMGLIQALVFSLLAAIYISEAAEHGGAASCGGLDMNN